MAFRQQSPDPMDFAKIAGQRVRKQEARQDLLNQQAQIQEDMGKFSLKKTISDVFGNIASGKLLDLAFLGLTSGASALFPAISAGTKLPGISKFFKSIAKPLEDKTNIFNKLLDIGGKGALRTGISQKINPELSKMIGIEAPSAPSLDMSKYIGAGMSGTRQSIADMLETSKSAYDIRMGSEKSNQQLLNLLMSFSKGLKTDLGKLDPVEIFGKKIYGGTEKGETFGSIEEFVRELMNLNLTDNDKD